MELITVFPAPRICRGYICKGASDEAEGGSIPWKRGEFAMEKIATDANKVAVL